MRLCAPLRADADGRPDGARACPATAPALAIATARQRATRGGGARGPGCRVPVQGACEILAGVAR